MSVGGSEVQKRVWNPLEVGLKLKVVVSHPI